MPSTSEVLRRSIDNVLANWETLLLEGVLLLIFAAALRFGIMPRLVRLWPTPSGVHPDLRQILPVVGILVVTAVAGALLLLLLTAFATAANTRLYIAGARAAAAGPDRPRAAYRVFTVQAWLAGGVAAWGRVFAIELVAGAVLLVVVGLPVLALFALPRAVAGCFGFILVPPLMIVAIVATTLWARKAIVVAVGHGATVGEALRIAWQELTSHFAAHFVPALVIGLVALAAALAIGLVGIVARAAAGPGSGVRDVVPFFRSAASAIGSCWMTAAFVSLTEEADRRA